MYSGITRGVFPVTSVEKRSGVSRFSVALGETLCAGVELGASISVDGVCLSVVAFDAREVSFEAIAETTSLTTLGELSVGRLVSVERSVRAGDELGGHNVYGHIIGTGEVLEHRYLGEQLDLRIGVPKSWMKYILPKGFIGLDGSSLTVGSERHENSFEVHLIPETLRLTNFKQRTVGTRINVELDAQTVAIVDTVERVMNERFAQRGSD